ILPDANIFDFYRDIRTYGRGHEDYYENASHNHVLFFRYNPEDPPVVEKSDDELHSLTIRVKDTLTENLEILVPVDLVVLSVGMIPHKIDEIIDMLKLPVGLDRYLLEIHPKLRPVETAINGVLLAGTAQGPKDISESCEAASAAAAKGVAMLSRGYVELDPYVAVVDQDRCSGSGKCAEACAYSGAIKMEEVQVNGASIQKATINPALCKGCGSCAAVCSNNAIEIKGWTLRQFEAMVDAIVESEEEPVIGGVI
ncbi:MAG: 4Fe-4S binding protein, partial [Chloroflexota bacterium]|nr:4Fe-4S binding protein [Chloroflexota bacterium]